MQPRKKNLTVDINPPKIGNNFLEYGKERIKELLAQVDLKTTYLPKSISDYDMDHAMRDFVRDHELKLIIDKKDVPVIFLTNERWGEFSKTWIYTDGDKNLPTPFLTIRKSGREEGTRMGTKWNVPNGRMFKYLDVPVLDEGQEIFLRFKINQPINTDLLYEIKLFTKYQKDVNECHKMFDKVFRSRQGYVFVKGNPMPVLLEGIGDESNLQNVNGDRMYVITYTLRLQGFVLYEDDFQVVKTYRKPKLDFNILGERKTKNNIIPVSQIFDETFDETFG
jgi:hypothetical protein